VVDQEPIGLEARAQAGPFECLPVGGGRLLDLSIQDAVTAEDES